MKNFPYAISAIFWLLLGLFAWYLISWRFHKHPDLKRTYAGLFVAWFFWVNTPFIFLNFHFEDLAGTSMRTANVIWACLPTIWILFLNGAEVLEKHPGLPFMPVGRAVRIRIYAILISAIIVLFTLLTEDFWKPVERVQSMFFPGFIAAWIAASYLFSIISGWQWLAESYRSRDRFAGKKRGWQSGTLGCISMNHCWTLGANDSGLYLAMNFLFRIGHPPLFIPWSDIEVGRRRLLFFSSIVFEFAKAPGVLLVLTERRAANLARSHIPAASTPLSHLFSGS
jgi:hypothetical protein